MGYGISHRDGSVQDAVRRIAGEQFRRALQEIDDRRLDFPAKVQQARKRAKKLRGLVRLVRPAFDGYDDENAALRDAARLLSGLRDADTLISTYDDVTGHFGNGVDRRAFASIRARLTRDARKSREEPAAAGRLQDFRAAIEGARARAKSWKLGEDGFDALAGGLAKTYRRARICMDAAWRGPDDAAMHEWRKRVKYHGHHARLLGSVHPDMIDPAVKAADELAELLGMHHDLAVMDARLRDAPEDFGSADIGAFRALLAERKDAVAALAFAHGRLTLAERPKPLVKRWRGYWKSWRAGAIERPGLLVRS